MKAGRVSPRTALALLGALILALALGLRLADDWRQAERREAYLPELEAQARRSPYDGPLLALLGARHAEAHEQRRAALALRRALAAGEQRPEVWQILAAALAATGDRPQALAALRAGRQALPGAAALEAAWTRVAALGPDPEPPTLAQAIAPDGPQPLVAAYTRPGLLSGLIAWRGRRPEQSGFSTRQEWARQRPDDAQAQRLWALALVRNRRLPEAADAFRRALALAPRSPRLRLDYAEALSNGGLPQKAGPEYIAALALRPDWLPALLGLGRNSLRLDLKSAQPAFRRATQIAPGSPEAWIGLGRAALSHRADIRESLQAFQTAAALAPQRTDFYTDYAEALRQDHRFDEAEALLRQRLRAAPDDALAHYRLGAILLENRSTAARLAEAEAETREALRLRPRAALAHVQLGKLLLGAGKTGEAADAFQAAIAADPHEITARRLLSQVYGRLGQPERAAQVAARATELFDAHQRINVLENAKEQQFLDPALREELVRLYRRTGEADKEAQEREMLRMLRQDPAGTARSYREYRASLRRVFGPAAR